MEQNNLEIPKNTLLHSDNMEQRITSMLEDILKGDSSDEDIKKNNTKLNSNPKFSDKNIKPMICLNDIPVSEDIYVIKDSYDFNLLKGNNSKIEPKKNTNSLDIKINPSNYYLPKNVNLQVNNMNLPNHKNKDNLNISDKNKNSNFLQMIAKPQNQIVNKNTLNFGNNTNNSVNSNSLNFNNTVNFNLSPHMEKRKENNLTNYINNGINITNYKEKNLSLMNTNNSNTISIPAVTNKSNMVIPVIF